MLTNYFDKTRD